MLHLSKPTECEPYSKLRTLGDNDVGLSVITNVPPQWSKLIIGSLCVYRHRRHIGNLCTLSAILLWT